jgi:hypothetical protein
VAQRDLGLEGVLVEFSDVQEQPIALSGCSFNR